MNYTFNANSIPTSRIVNEDYFPAIVEFSSEELNNHFIEFNYKDSDMFEISVHPDTHELKRFSLTLCNHYSFSTSELTVPDAANGTLIIDGPDVTECEAFMTKVFTNGIQIVTSDKQPCTYCRSGHLVFAIADDKTVTSVYIVNLNAEDIKHIKDELI